MIDVCIRQCPYCKKPLKPKAPLTGMCEECGVVIEMKTMNYDADESGATIQVEYIIKHLREEKNE